MNPLPAKDLCIAVPVYNRTKFLAKTLKSVEGLVVLGAKVLVVDDGSTEAAYREVQAIVPPSMILIRNPKNLGLFPNLQNCLQLSQREFTIILCSDDHCREEFVLEALKRLAVDSSIGLITSRGEVIDSEGVYVRSFADAVPAALYHETETAKMFLNFHASTGINPYNYPSGIVLRTKTALEAGGFNPQFRHVGDMDMYLRMSLISKTLVVDDVGCTIVFHPEQEGFNAGLRPWGIRELVMIDEAMGKSLALPSHIYSKWQSKHLALGLLYTIGLMRQGSWESVPHYLREIVGSKSSKLSIIFCFFKLILSKILKTKPSLTCY
jgi:glycosyltransferase involved in cell wall biosynthesis